MNTGTAQKQTRRTHSAHEHKGHSKARGTAGRQRPEHDTRVSSEDETENNEKGRRRTQATHVENRQSNGITRRQAREGQKSEQRKDLASVCGARVTLGNQGRCDNE